MVGQTQRAGHGHRHDAGMGDRRQIDIPHTVTELGRDASRDLNAETSLAGTAGTGPRHQPVSDEQLSQVSHLCAAADKVGELHRKVVRDSGLCGTQRGEIVAQVGILPQPRGTPTSAKSGVTVPVGKSPLMLASIRPPVGQSISADAQIAASYAYLRSSAHIYALWRMI